MEWIDKILNVYRVHSFIMNITSSMSSQLYVYCVFSARIVLYYKYCMQTDVINRKCEHVFFKKLF